MCIVMVYVYMVIVILFLHVAVYGHVCTSFLCGTIPCAYIYIYIYSLLLAVFHSVHLLNFKTDL